MSNPRMPAVLLIRLGFLWMLISLWPSSRSIAVEAEFQSYRSRPHACRFWSATSEQLPDEVARQHLLTLPFSMLKLSAANPDGWALAFWPELGGEPDLRRGALQADQDSLFTTSAERLCNSEPMIAMGHIRNCSSGLCDIPNPHLFRRQMDGRTWLFGHNGDIAKELLLDLIEPDFLAANPPAVGGNQEEWVDSELFFIYLLQCFAQENWQVKPGLGKAVGWLRARIPGDQEYLNFVLSDGENLWAYREGPSAFRLHREESVTHFTAIASRYPGESMGSWIPMLNGELVTVGPGSPAVVESIDLYLDATTNPDFADTVTSAKLWPNYPNPFNPATTIRFELSEPAWLTVAIFDLRGARVAQLADGPCDGGRFEINWQARAGNGEPLPTGIYLLRLSAGDLSITRKVVLAK